MVKRMGRGAGKRMESLETHKFPISSGTSSSAALVGAAEAPLGKAPECFWAARASKAAEGSPAMFFKFSIPPSWLITGCRMRPDWEPSWPTTSGSALVSDLVVSFPEMANKFDETAAVTAAKQAGMIKSDGAHELIFTKRQHTTSQGNVKARNAGASERACQQSS